MARHGDQPHVAVIEHAPEIQLLFQELLAAEAYRVTVFEECPDSAERVAELMPDIVVHDYAPASAETDLASLHRLTTDPRTYHIPIVLCSAASDIHDVADKLAPRPQVVPKPFALDDLLDVIRAGVRSLPPPQVTSMPQMRRGHGE
jgi:CheY-like chemotaxis protein